MQTKKTKASILVVTMMILGIVLVTALSISVVSIQERKASMGSNKSNQAYQVADTGIEKVMDVIVKNRELSVADILGGFFGFSCDDTSGHAILTKTGEAYTVELKKTTDAEITYCTSATPLSDIASIKSIGTNSGQQRAIEAAVAAPGEYTKICKIVGVGWQDTILVPDDWIKENCYQYQIAAASATDYFVGCLLTPTASIPMEFGGSGGGTPLINACSW